MISPVSFSSLSSTRESRGHSARVVDAVTAEVEPQDKMELSSAPLKASRHKLEDGKFGCGWELIIPIIPAVIGLIIKVIDKVWPDAQPKHKQQPALQQHEGFLIA